MGQFEMALFERHKSTTKRSFALRAFNANETEINEHFWSFKAISDHARYIASEHEHINPTYSTAMAFSATGPDARRIPPTVTDWLDARKELENWLRLSALVSAAAYHEAYLRQIVRSALMADPMVRAGLPKTVDGTFFLKKGIELPYDHEITSITKGEWSSRSAYFERLFGSLPPTAFPISDLEEIRKARNDYAHGFGRTLDVLGPSEMRGDPARRLSQTRLISLVAILSRSAKEIDKHLLSNFIGDFELIHAFHNWPQRGIEDRSGRSEARTFQIYMHKSLGISKSQEFCEGLIAHYRTA